MEKNVKKAGDNGGVLIVGCGYLGFRVANVASQVGMRVWATTRNPERATQFAAIGWEPLLMDWTDPSTLTRLPKVDRILVAVSYDSTSGIGRHDAQVGGLQNLLSATDADAHMTYISTTGVYHQTDGSWVDEGSPANPSREGGRAHLDAEKLLLEHRTSAKSTVLRLAGIYGPKRVPRVADVVAGRPIRTPESGYLNLIHVDDAASAVMATWQQSNSGQQREPLYVVADDQPVVRGEFYREVARQRGVPEPKFEVPVKDASVSMRSSSNKRIRNRCMKRDLVPRLRFPTYREGLSDVLASMSEGQD